MTNRITGTNSGIDVDTVVKQSLSTEQNKIDKAYQQQMVYTYQQEQLKEIVSQAQDFYDKYLDILSGDSLLKSSAYETASFTSTSTAVTAIGYAGADVTDYTVTVTQLASKASSTISTNDLKSTDNISVRVNGKTILVEPTLVDGSSTEIDYDKTVKDLNTQLKKQGINVTAKYSQFAKGIVLESGDMGKDASFELKVGDEEFKTYNGQNAKGSITKGTDTVEIDSSSNKITVDNVQFTFNATTKGTTDTSIDNLVDNIKKYTDDNGNEVEIEGNITKITAKDGAVTEIDEQYGKTVTTTTINGKQKVTVNYSDGSSISSGYTSIVDIKMTSASYETEDGSKVSISADGSKKITSADGQTVTTIDTDGNQKTESFDKVTLSGKTDISNLKDTIVNFMNDYNKLVENINAKLWETRDTDYMPLTDEQKSDMSESEIESWEKKAQTGLLRNDSDLKKIQNSMKTAMSSMMGSTGLTLESIGIEPVDNYTTKNGMYKIDEDKLTSALQNNAEEVKDLFTRSEGTTINKKGEEVKDPGGVLTQLQSLLKNEVKSSSSSLSKKIGFDGTSTESSNTLLKNITKQKKLVKELQERYEDKETALYTKYSNLEVMLEKLNSQSNSLYAMLGIS